MYEKRVSILYACLVLCASLLLCRIYNLSKPETNKALSVLDGQYTGILDVCSRDGFIYDTNGGVISHKVSSYVALINPSLCDNALYYAERLSKYSAVLDISDIYERLCSSVPFTLTLKDKADIGLYGVYVFETYESTNDIAKHFIGYHDYDGKGVCGLRYAYSDLLEKRLHGRVRASFDTTAKGGSLSPFTLEYLDYVCQSGVVTTLDKGLQRYTDSLDGDIVSGAVVVSKIDTGEILAASSFPSYDVKNMEHILSSNKGELVNRVTSSFTPGSVFKIIVCLAALDKDLSLYDFTYTCEGKSEVEGNIFHCHNRSGHGKLDMKSAFAESCNTYFIALGQRVGLDGIADCMKKLGLDKETRADFLSEGENYFIDEQNTSEGYLANISFGQGDLRLSALDMTRVMTAAMSGYLHELKSIKGYIEKGSFIGENENMSKRIFSGEITDKMKALAHLCVNEGTGKSAKDENLNIGGKTATAQTGVYDEKGVEKVHKWFCGVDDVENPSIVVTVLCDFTTDADLSPAVVCKNILKYAIESRV